ncbi:MAG: peptidoglycan-binding protein [Oscillospiraceae bacterium]|nr:peptidoglycan-binding protein [Oscillospiraceae bacterium]
MFIQREKPSKGDVWFTGTESGGISTCIKGQPTDPNCDRLANCVSIVGAYNKAACSNLTKPKWGPILWPPNAGGILTYAQELGLPTSTQPAPGALIVWKKGELTLKNKNGHVAFVTDVEADGTIHTAESEWQGRAWVNRTYKPPYAYAAGYTFIGFVLQPGTTPAQVIKYIREGDKGAAVELMQSRLAGKGFMRKTEVDGDFGRITKGAVCCFQLENGLVVDGVCGPLTQAKLYG